MVKNLEYRGFQKSDTKGLIRLFSEVLSDGKTPDYWDWKYYQNPCGQHMTMIALQNSSLVGSIGSIPVRMNSGSKIFAGSQGVDTAIAPECRGGGVFFGLEGRQRSGMIAKNIHLTYAFSNSQTYEILTLIFGFIEVWPVYNLSKIINPAPYVQGKLGLGVAGGFIGTIGKHLICLFNKRPMFVPPGLRMEAIHRFDSRFDDLWREEASAYDIAVSRDSSYLNWRYIDSPKEYKIFAVGNDRTLKGFIVLGCYDEEVRRGRIVDILARNSDRTVIDLLLNKAISHFIREKMDVITCWMLEHWAVHGALIDKGFVPRKTPHNLIARSYVDHLSNHYLANTARWYVTMGDSDYY